MHWMYFIYSFFMLKELFLYGYFRWLSHFFIFLIFKIFFFDDFRLILNFPELGQVGICVWIVFPFVFQNYQILAGLLIQILLAFVEPDHILLMEILLWLIIKVFKVLTQHFPRMIAPPVLLDHYDYWVQNYNLFIVLD